MRPPFSPNQDRWLRTVFRLLIASVALLGFTGFAWKQWDFDREQGLPVTQPIPFSHEHHAGALEISCRYCHGTVDTTSFAGMPDTHACMSCHSQLWTNADALEPVRESYREGDPIRWQRVHDLADYVYFDHSAHVAHGMDCRVCHGEVEKMPQVWRNEKFSMEWCLDCHGDLEESHGFEPRGGGELYFSKTAGGGNKIGEEHPLERMENCSVCHR